MADEAGGLGGGPIEADILAEEMGRRLVLEHFATRPRRNAAVSSAKIVAPEAGRVVGGQDIQLYGGVGMTDEYQVGHYYKRLLVLEKSWGDVGFHPDRIGRAYR